MGEGYRIRCIGGTSRLTARCLTALFDLTAMMRLGWVGAHREGALRWGVGHPILVSGREETESAGGGGDVGTGVDVELGQDVTDVMANCLGGEAEALCYLGVAQPGGQERQDLELAGRQVGGSGTGTWARSAGNGSHATLPELTRGQRGRRSRPQPLERR